jgi:hypothetical protein
MPASMVHITNQWQSLASRTEERVALTDPAAIVPQTAEPRG